MDLGALTCINSLGIWPVGSIATSRLRAWGNAVFRYYLPAQSGEQPITVGTASGDEAGPGEHGRMEQGLDKPGNDAEQTFTPSVTKLLGVELELVVGNAGAEEDELTLTIMDASGKALANITQRVQTAGYARRNLPYEIERRNDVWLEIYSKRIRKRRRNL